jgi:hypothetical protein
LIRAELRAGSASRGTLLDRIEGSWPPLSLPTTPMMDFDSADWLQTYRTTTDGRLVYRGHCRSCGGDWAIGEHWDTTKVLGVGSHRDDCVPASRLRRNGAAFGAARMG